MIRFRALGIDDKPGQSQTKPDQTLACFQYVPAVYLAFFIKKEFIDRLFYFWDFFKHVFLWATATGMRTMRSVGGMAYVSTIGAMGSMRSMGSMHRMGSMRTVGSMGAMI
jgi:hypothetical protein